MEDIELPAVLNPTRSRLEGQLSKEAAQAEMHDLQRALDEAADYGQALWRQLDAVRHHLVAMLPDPQSADDLVVGLTAPRGPQDDAGWTDWQTAYASVTSALAGPKGDSGFGRHEARSEAMARRGAANYSDRTAQLVDIATERRVRVEEQLGPGLASLPADPDHDATGGGHPETGPAAVARTPSSAAAPSPAAEPARSPGASDSRESPVGTPPATPAHPVVLAAFGAGFAAGAVAGRLSKRSSATA